MKKLLLAVFLMTGSIGAFANANNNLKPSKVKTSKNNEPTAVYCKVSYKGVILECVLCDCEVLLKRAYEEVLKKEKEKETDPKTNTQQGQIGG